MERCRLGLRRLADLAEHLRRRRLVEPDRVVLRAADHPDRLEHAQHAETGDVGGELGLVEAERHERDRTEVVDLVGLRQLERGHQRRQVGEIAGDRLDVRHLLEQLGDARVALTLHHPEHVVALTVQELGEMLTVLAGDSGDERTWHGGGAPHGRGRSTAESRRTVGDRATGVPCVRWAWASLGRASVDPAHHGPHHASPSTSARCMGTARAWVSRSTHLATALAPALRRRARIRTW